MTPEERVQELERRKRNREAFAAALTAAGIEELKRIRASLVFTSLPQGEAEPLRGNAVESDTDEVQRQG